jgi:hypothetical protein
VVKKKKSYAKTMESSSKKGKKMKSSAEGRSKREKQ